ncbi:hypothetical protein [Nitrosomonas communis]
MPASGNPFRPEQIVNLLRKIEVMIANGKALLEACRWKVEQCITQLE